MKKPKDPLDEMEAAMLPQHKRMAMGRKKKPKMPKMPKVSLGKKKKR